MQYVQCHFNCHLAYLTVALSTQGLCYFFGISTQALLNAHICLFAQSALVLCERNVRYGYPWLPTIDAIHLTSQPFYFLEQPHYGNPYGNAIMTKKN